VPASLAGVLVYLYPAIVAVPSVRYATRLAGRRPWVALGIATGVFDARYLFAVPVLLLHFAVFYSFSAMLAVWTRSTVVCVFGTLLFWVLCWGMNFGRHAVVAHDPAAEGADQSGSDGRGTGREVVSLGLGPLGLPRPGVVPEDPMAVDYDRTVHRHGDRFVAQRATGPDDPALLVGATAYDQATLAGLAAVATASPPGGALLVTEPLHDPRTVLAGLLVPLATGVTVVLCRHVDPAVLPARIAQEGAVAAVAEGYGPLPEWNRSVAGMP